MENKNAYENNEEVRNSLREDDERMNLYTDRNEDEQNTRETPEHSDDVIILGSSYPQEELALSQEREALLDSPTALQSIAGENIAASTQEALQINDEMVKEETMQKEVLQVQSDVTISDDCDVDPVTQQAAMPVDPPEDHVDDQESMEQTNPQFMESHTQEYASFVQARENAKASQQKSAEDEMLTDGCETIASDLPPTIDYEEEVMQTLAAEPNQQSTQIEPQAHEAFESVHHASEARHAFDDQPHIDQTQYSQEEDFEANGSNGGRGRKNRSAGSFLQRHRNASIAVGCLLLSIGGGFGGTLAAISFNKVNGSGAVLYQSVSNTSTGSSKKSNGSAMSIKDVANKTMESVVEIKTESVSNNSFFQQAVQSGAGSGVILSKDGYIVSNNHVISGANKIMVTTKDGKSYEAKLIGTDSSSDLAILKVEADNLTPAVMGSSSDLEVGDTAIAIGNPLGELGGTVTSGIISALDREINIDNQTMHLLQTNAAINPGNSGGGLFNDQGELIGVVNAKSSGESIEGLGFAIPIDRAKSIITNLIENGYVKGRASLGVSLTVGSSSPFSQENESQVYIYQVVEGKAADKAGLKKGDLILKVDDTKVSAISDVANAVNSHKAGENIKITILRESETKTVEVTLGEADATNSEDNAENSINNNR